MKRKLVLTLTVIAIIAAVLGGVYFLSLSHKKEVAQEKVYEAVDGFKKMQKQFAKNKFSDQGTVNVIASYKGAHGERYPHDYTFNFTYNNDILSIGNDSGYYDKEVKLPTTFISKLLKVSLDKFANVKEAKTTNNVVEYKLDIKKINDSLNTNFTKGSIRVNFKGFLVDYESVEITMDDIKIVYTDKKYVITKGDNKIELTTSEAGVNFKVNNNIKGNYIYNGNMVNVVIDNDAYSITFKENGFSIRTTASHAIYNAFEANVEFTNVELKRNRVVEEIDIPIWRYLGDTNYKIWS